MKNFRSIITGLLLLTSGLAFGQTTDSIKMKIVGKWLLVKHTLVEHLKIVDKLTPDTKDTYEFKNDGAYRNTTTNKFGTVIVLGHWRISSDGKSIETYNNKFLPPSDHTGTTINNDADHPLKIIKLTLNEFVPNECLL